MTIGALRISAIALGPAAFAVLSPLPSAGAATVVHHPAHGVHRQVAHVHGRVYAHHSAHAHRYAYRNGYNPGAAVAAGVIGGAAAGYPYSCDYYGYGPYGGCDYGDYGYDGPYFGGFGFGSGFHNRRFGLNHGFQGGGSRFVGGNFGHMGGFGGGHMGGFGGGHMGGFGGGHFGGGGGHIR